MLFNDESSDKDVVHSCSFIERYNRKALDLFYTNMAADVNLVGDIPVIQEAKSYVGKYRLRLRIKA